MWGTSGRAEGVEIFRARLELADCTPAGLFGRVGYLENRIQLSDLEQVLGSRPEIAQPQGSAPRLRAGMGGDERAEAGAVQHRDAAQIEDQVFLSFGQQGFHFFAERAGFLPADEAPVQRQQVRSVHFLMRYFQGHGAPSSQISDCGHLEQARQVKFSESPVIRGPRVREYTPGSPPPVIIAPQRSGLAAGGWRMLLGGFDFSGSIKGDVKKKRLSSRTRGKGVCDIQPRSAAASYAEERGYLILCGFQL